jgi:tetratricopeptide repeat protein
VTSRPGRPTPSPAPSTGADATPLVLSALGACLALPVLASFTSTNWLWGLDTLRWWPVPAAIGLAILGAAGFVPAVARAIGRALEKIGAAWEARPRRGDALAAAIVFATAFVLRDRILFVGDSALRAGALSLDVPMARLFPQAFPLDLAINVHLARVLALQGLNPLTALQLVGALLAALFTLATLAFLKSIGARGALLPAAAVVLLGGGYLVHFAGYDKYGPLLVGIALAAAGAARLARDRRGAWTLALGTTICVLSTRVGYTILPPALLAYLLAWRHGTHRPRIAAAAGFTLLIALAMLPRAIDILLGFDRQVHMPGGAVARTLGSSGAPDLLVRLSDALNVLFFLVPLWPAGVAAVLGVRAARSSAPVRGSGLAAVAALALALQLAIVFAIRARQGVARDWDAYVGAGLVVGLVTAGALVSWWRAAGGGAGSAAGGRTGTSMTRPAAVTVALACAVALWGLHAGESMSLRRLEAQLAASPAWGEAARAAAYDRLGLRALRLGRYEEAARHFERATAVAPNPRFLYQAGLAYLGAMRLDPAEAAFRRSVQSYHHIADPWVGLARVSLARGDSLGAMTCLDSALAREPRHPEAADMRRALVQGLVAR